MRMAAMKQEVGAEAVGRNGARGSYETVGSKELDATMRESPTRQVAAMKRGACYDVRGCDR